MPGQGIGRSGLNACILAVRLPSNAERGESMLAKAVVVIVGIAVIAFLTSSFWASCDIKYQICTTVCDIRHINSDLKKAGCKGSCTSKKIACISKKVIEKQAAP